MSAYSEYERILRCCGQTRSGTRCLKPAVVEIGLKQFCTNHYAQYQKQKLKEKSHEKAVLPAVG